MDSFIHVTIGTALFALLNGAALGTAAFTAGATKWSGLDKLLGTIAIAAMHIVAVLVLAGALGIISVIPVSLLSLAASGALFFGFRKTGSFSWISKLYQDIRNAITTSPLLALLMAPTAAVYALAYLYAAPRPPMGFDSLTYHLPIAANMIRTGGFEVFYFPHFFDLYSYLPANGDLFSVWVMLPFGCDFLLPWVNLPFLAMLSISAYKIAMDLHVPRPLALVVAMALITPPFFLTTLTESYVDIPLFAVFLASVRFAVLASRDKSAAILAAGMAGITVGIKSTGLLLAAMTYVLHLSLTFKANRKTWFKVNGQFTLWMIIMILVLGSVFYIRNWIIAGNPIFPVPLSLPFIGPLTSLEHYSYSLPHSTFMAQWDFLLYSGKWLNAILGESITLSGGWGLGPLGLMALFLVPILVAVAVRKSAIRLEIWTFFTLGVIALVSYLFTPYAGKFLMFNVRFAYPAVMLLLLTGVAALAQAGVSSSALTLAILVTQIGGFFFSRFPVTSFSGLLLSLLALAIPVILLLHKKLPKSSYAPSKMRQIMTIAAYIAVGLFLVTTLHNHRDKSRYNSWFNSQVPYATLMSDLSFCFAALDKNQRDGKVAVAADDSRNTFVFPLFGSHLTRDVAYINVSSPDHRASHLWPTVNIRENPDLDAWMQNLSKQNASTLFVFRDDREDLPIENRWIREMPDQFETLIYRENCAVYRIKQSQP